MSSQRRVVAHPTKCVRCKSDFTEEEKTDVKMAPLVGPQGEDVLARVCTQCHRQHLKRNLKARMAVKKKART